MTTLGTIAQDGFIRPPPPTAGSEPAQDSPAGDAAETPRADPILRLLVALISVTGVALVVHGAINPDHVDWKALVVLAGLAVIAERMDLSLYGDSRVSLAFVPIFASVILAGMSGVAMVVPVAMIGSSIGGGRPLYKTAFNFGALMIAGATSAMVFSAIGTSAHDWPEALMPTLVAGGANFLVNSSLVAIAIALSSRSSIRAVWDEHFLWLCPHYLVMAVLALSIVAAYDAMGFWGIGVFLAPPIMMRLSIKQYLDRTTRNVLDLRAAHGNLQTAHEQLTEAMASLGSAYDGTLRSLVAALDARDSETAGHSERVAELTMAIAKEMGMQPETDEWRHVSWGALLHDVGKIAIPDDILRKPSGLSESEWQFMRSHPQAGFEILQSVDFLAPAAGIVLAHHERYDGTGYPNGLAGEEVPIGARIFTIADAFDAMTSDRAYRSAMAPEEALAEILRNSGSQFDPTAVRAFLTVYQQRFLGSSFRRRHSGSPHESEPELAESLKNAIAEAAGLERGT